MSWSVWDYFPGLADELRDRKVAEWSDYLHSQVRDLDERVREMVERGDCSDEALEALHAALHDRRYYKEAISRALPDLLEEHTDEPRPPHERDDFDAFCDWYKSVRTAHQRNWHKKARLTVTSG